MRSKLSVLVLALACASVLAALIAAHADMNMVVGRDDGWVFLRDGATLDGIAMTPMGAPIKWVVSQPNGNILVVREDTGITGVVFLLSGVDLSEIARYDASLPLTHMVLQPDGDVLITRNDGFSFLLNGSNLTEIGRFYAYLPVTHVTVQPDGDFLITRDDGWNFLVSGATQAPNVIMAELGRFNPSLPVTNVAVQPDGDFLITREDGWNFLVSGATQGPNVTLPELGRFNPSLAVSFLAVQSGGNFVLTREDGYTWLLAASDLSVLASQSPSLAAKMLKLQPDNDVVLVREDDFIFLYNGAGLSQMALSNAYGLINQMVIRPDSKIGITNTDASLYLADGDTLSSTAVTGIYGNITALAVQMGTPQIDTISTAKMKDDGASASGLSGIVTLSKSDYFYFEDTDRFTGIRVYKPGHPVWVGDKASVSGTLDTMPSGERQIVASAVGYVVDQELAPMDVNNRALGGGDFYYDPGPPKSGQQGVAGASGLNNIGLLMRTTGKVTEKDTGPTPAWFKIDDGSGVSVKVFGNVPVGTPYVAVSGASSCEKDGNGNIQRAIIATLVQEVSP